MKSILVHAWAVYKNNDTYYLPYTHAVYLNEILKYYEKVTLLSPTFISTNEEFHGMISLKKYKNLSVEELPAISGYIGAIKYFFKYCNKYKKHSNHSAVYARYPVPFGWLQRVYFKQSQRIIHFVGSPIDAAKTNPNFSSLKKKLLVLFFQPEHILYLWACKKAKVYTNGTHLAERLQLKGVKATPIISSTLNKDDFYRKEDRFTKNNVPKIIYVGYLRRAKGVEIVINAFRLLLKEYPNSKLTIVGTGEFENDLKNIVRTNNIKNITFTGHIENRVKLNELLRLHDIFCFASFSEGSPRVILEAMANGLNVVSTPVGSLPLLFKDNEHIMYANFKDDKMFCDKIVHLITDYHRANKIRQQAYNKAKQYTIDKFLKNIFDET